MKPVIKHICTTMALCILSGICIAPFSAFAEEKFEPLYGDADNNSEVDVSDAVLVARFSAEDSTAVITEAGRIQADVNLDGTINTEDTVQILAYIAKLRDKLGVAEPKKQVSFKTVNLSENLTAETVEGKEADAAFIASQLGFTANLLRETHKDTLSKLTASEAPKNLLISPLSLSLALSMTANGAKGNTKTQMEQAISGTLGMDDLNAYYYDYMANLPSTEGANLHIANSIWGRNTEALLSVPEAFLKTTKSYYNADFYSAPFDDTTFTDINDWVKANTHDMIPKLIQTIQPTDLMFLLNAIAFEADWSIPYREDQISESNFTLESGTKVKAEFMHADQYKYICDDKATGFIKPYKDANYSFAAVLPNQDVTVSDYINDMTADSLKKLLNSVTEENVDTRLPKFSFDYGTSLKKVLNAMGMNTPFDETAADFTGLNSAPINTFISDVIHKTFITVDEKGTKAGAVTAVIMATNSVSKEPKRVYLDRPFLFMIIDNQNKLPIFIGYVMNPAQTES